MNKISESKKSMLFVLAAGMLWGCMGILVRTMNKSGFGSLEVTAFRSLVTSIVMLAYMFLFNRKELKIKLKDIWCFVGTGILSVTFFNVCYFSCMQYTTLSVAAIMLYTAPAFVIVMSFFLFKEKLTKRKISALILAFVGCICVSGGIGDASIDFMAIITGLGAGFGYALYSIFSRYALQRGYSSFTITTYTFLFALAGTVPFIKEGHFKQCLVICGTEIWFPIIMAFVTTVLAYMLYTAGLKGLENGKASIVASIEPVMASVIGFLLYKEVIPPIGLAGMILVLISCILLA